MFIFCDRFKLAADLKLQSPCTTFNCMASGSYYSTLRQWNFKTASLYVMYCLSTLQDDIRAEIIRTQMGLESMIISAV